MLTKIVSNFMTHASKYISDDDDRHNNKDTLIVECDHYFYLGSKSCQLNQWITNLAGIIFNFMCYIRFFMVKLTPFHLTDPLDNNITTKTLCRMSGMWLLVSFLYHWGSENRAISMLFHFKNKLQPSPNSVNLIMIDLQWHYSNKGALSSVPHATAYRQQSV